MTFCTVPCPLPPAPSGFAQLATARPDGSQRLERFQSGTTFALIFVNRHMGKVFTQFGLSNRRLRCWSGLVGSGASDAKNLARRAASGRSLVAVIALGSIRKLHFDPKTAGSRRDFAADSKGETCGFVRTRCVGKEPAAQSHLRSFATRGRYSRSRRVSLHQASDDELRATQAAIGYLFQNNALFDSLTVFENVAFPLRQRARLSQAIVDESDLRQRAEHALRGVGLFPPCRKMPSQLSGGQRKRVALARAVVTRPPLLIYDEPTAGLDPVTTAKIYDLLHAERELTQATTLVVSSDIDALRRFAPRMLMLYRGGLCYDGPSDRMEQSESAVVRQFVRGDLEGPL